jgi:hypothetical protein
MAAGKSSSLFKILLILSTYLAVYLVVIGDGYLVRMIERENAMNAAFYSQPVADEAIDRANRWFTVAFVDSGVMAHTFEPFLPTEEEIARARHMEDFGQPIFEWFEGRMRAWWTLVWSAFTRFSSILIWGPVALLLFIPWVIDGWTQREVKKNTFDFASPVQQRFAMMAIGVLPIAFLVIVTAPVPMHPLVTPGAIIGAGILVQIAIANFMKRA